MKILIAEDDERIRRVLKMGFEQTRLMVDEAEDGEQALAMLESDHYDILVLDWMMPNRDGLSVIKALRSQKNKIPIILLTAKGETTDKITGLDAGADDYLAKPFSFNELLARVRALMRRPPQLQENILNLADLDLDLNNFIVKRAGGLIKLSKTEYKLLEYLMRHQGQIFSKQEIINQVWDFDANILPNTVEAHIRSLRQKIDQPFQKKLIKTVRGFGYKIDAK